MTDVLSDEWVPAAKWLKDDCGANPIWNREAECLSPEEHLLLANEAWGKLRGGLFDRSPFYRRKCEEAGVDLATIRDVKELSRLPLTTKDELRRSQEEHPPFGDYLGVPQEQVKLVFGTSGTTGNPSLVALTHHDVQTWTETGCRGFFTSGVHAHSSVLTTFGAGPFVAGATHGVLDRIGARRVPVGPGDTARVISSFERGLADTFLGTPSYALYLTQRFDTEGVDPRAFGLTHLILGGEPGGGIPSIRNPIERAFGCYVTESMGLGDVSGMIYGECLHQQGMHFNAQGFVWVELIDRDTEEPLEIETGVVGEPVYTTLAREAMPVVRFRSGDLLEVQGTSCDCGRTGFRMRCIGRADDMIIVRGVNVYPSAIQAIVGEFRPATTGRCRVVLDEAEGSRVSPPVAVEVEHPDGVTPEPDLARRIEHKIRDRLTFRAAISFVPESVFGPAGYKTRSIVRRETEA